jgi:putative transposon-encoded protein
LAFKTEKYLKISIDILLMRKIEIKKAKFVLKEQVELVYEKIITPFGTSAKIDAPRGIEEDALMS